MAKLKSLREAVLAGYDDVGRIGTNFLYMSIHGLPLVWNVRVLTGEDEPLLQAPYSLGLLTPCCHRQCQSYRERCANCDGQLHELYQQGIMSIMGRNAGYTTSHLGKLLQLEKGVDPLRAAMQAIETIEEIEMIHRELISPEWAQECIDRIQGKYLKPAEV